MSGTVSVEQTELVATIWLDRPHVLNAVNGELSSALAAALEGLLDHPPRVVLIRGRGRSFCSGFDLKQEDVGDRMRQLGDIERIQDVTRLIRRLPCPVVAVVHGYALGAGCELALGCDLIVASENATFGFPEVGVGLGITGGVTQLLPNVVGPARAKWLVFLSERFDARCALELGLVNQVVPEQQLDGAAAALAERLAVLPAFAVAVAKRELNEGPNSGTEDLLARESLGAVACQDSSEAAAASREFRGRLGTPPPATVVGNPDSGA
jgi:enoyl-CoA hydratase/carnithine racemase